MAKNKAARKASHIKTLEIIAVFLIAIIGIALANHATGITGAVTADEVLSDDLLSQYKEMYNAKRAGLPDLVFTFFGEEVVNIYISDLDAHLYAVLEKGELVELESGTQENPTLSIETTYDTLVKLQQGDITLPDAVNQGLVSFSSDSFVKEAELSTVLYSIDIYGRFS
ncbi:hypothetical protein HZA99_04370 [Candidatus Woesearchaeota archaeon]|nr:hypothetical protein [Candidatus Woesearchaeota archaeon]